MIKKLLYILFTVVFVTNIQAQFLENFNDGGFNANPNWNGDESKFNINTNKQLQLNGISATDTAYLSTVYTAFNKIEYKIYGKLNFAPSNSNFTKIFLASNNANLKDTLSGYFVRIGRNGAADGLEFFRKDGNTETQLLNILPSTFATNPEFNLLITKNNIGNWVFGWNDNTIATYTLIDSIVDNTYHYTTNYFGMLCGYTTTNKTNFYFDDISVIDLSIVDTTAPKIDTIIVANKTELLVKFDELLDSVSAVNIANYTIVGIGNPSSIVLDADKKTVHLIFTSNFSSNQSYSLNTNNIKDVLLNTSTLKTKAFVAPFFVTFKSILINEIMADPTPVIGLPEKEFIELYNTTNQAISLQNWTLSDGSSSAIFPNITILPNAYLIVCANADTNSFSSYGNVVGLSNFPSLNNTNDNITLKSNTTETIDSVNYIDDWYNDIIKKNGGFSLSLKDVNTACLLNNWTASNSTIGGTPGTLNFPIPITTIANITNVSIVGNNKIQVSFSDNIDTTIAKNIANYSINNNTISAINIINNNNIGITFNNNIANNIIYNFINNNLKLCNGNNIKNDTNTFAITDTGKFLDIIITEILADETPIVGLPQNEYIEIYNRSNTVINLQNWKLKDGTSFYTLPKYFLAPNEYITLVSNTAYSGFKNTAKCIALNTFPTLTNSGESLTLYNANNSFIFNVIYSDTWYNSTIKKDGGWALEMKDINNPCGEANNWSASTANIGGTPSLINSIATTNTDILPINISNIEVIDSITIHIAFTEKININTVSNSVFSIDNTIGIVNNKNIIYPTINTIQVVLPQAIQTGVLYTLTINGLTDCIGNNIGINTTIQFGLPQNIEIGDLVINEILFNPKSGGVDFVEIYNKTNKILSTKNLIIAKLDPISEVQTDFINLSNTNKLILPQSYLVATSSKELLTIEHNNTIAENCLETAIPNFDDNEDIIVLYNSNLQEIDKLKYDHKWQFSLLNSEEGVSLERINFNNTTQDKNNWHSAAQTVGFATPGFLNSTYTEIAVENNIKIEPEIFSPNQDGQDDFLNIGYAFDNSGYVVNVRIFDADGRKVIHLIKNEIIPQKGSFIWDGTTENGERAKTGIYFLQIEILDLNGTIKSYRTKCVLATQL